MIELLAFKGARINNRNEDGYFIFFSGESFVFVFHSFPQLKFFLSFFSSSPLHCAITYGQRVNVVARLSAFGADCELIDDDGETPISTAVLDNKSILCDCY